jgi:1,4-dihydroxy-2-naphthoate octaprenyltransferase
MPGPAVWLRAVRAPSLTAGAMPAVVAAAAARSDGYAIDVVHASVTFVGLVALQAGVNLVNDYFDDASGLDADPDFADSAFPLGSRVIQQGLLTRAAVKRAAIACFALGAACGLVLDAVHPGHVVLWIGLAGFALGFFYTAPPLRIAYRGVGEPITFALFGPVGGLGAYYVLTGTTSAAAAVVSCAVGLLAMAILFLHHFPQREADERHSKRTPIVRLGHAGAGRLVPAILAAPYLLVLAATWAGVIGWGALAMVLTAPLAVQVSRTALRRPDHARAMAGAALQTLAIHFFGGLLLAGGVWGSAG